MINIAKSTRAWAEKNNYKSFYFEETDSTNNQAKADGIVKTQSPWIYIADQQTKGRGRGLNTWTNTTPGTSLLSTWCFELPSAPQPIAAPVFGCALYKTLNEEFDMALSIKPPNDICSGFKKLAGLLIESVSQGQLHSINVGLGLNVFEAPKGIDKVTSITEEIGAEIDETRWFGFLSKLRTNFIDASVACVKSEMAATYRTEILGALKKWPGNEIENILSNGDLVLKNSTRISWMSL